MAKTAPKHLSSEMKKFYKNICENFDLESHHLLLLTKCCECLDRAEQARKTLEEDGLFVEDRYGKKAAHPGIRIELENKSAARLLLRELGLDLESSEPGRGPRLY